MQTIKLTIRYRVLFIGILCAAIFCVSACGLLSPDSSKKEPKKECDKVLAEIGLTKICLDDFESRILKFPPAHRKKYKDQSGKLKLLHSLVEEELLSLEAINRGLENDPKIISRLAKIKKKVLVRRIKKSIKDEKIDISEEETRKYYEEHAEEYLKPETISVRHIFFKIKRKDSAQEKAKKKKQAENVLAKIKSGELTFQDAARKFSDDKVSAQNGGELPVIKKDSKKPLFAKVAFRLTKPDEISKVFKNRNGFNILQLIKKNEQEAKDFDTVKSKINKKIQQEIRKTRIENLKSRLESEIKIVINEDLLADEDVVEDIDEDGDKGDKLSSEYPITNGKQGDRGSISDELVNNHP